MSLCAFLTRSFRQPLKKASGEILNKKNLVKAQQPDNSFPTLSVVQAEQTIKNGKFGFLSVVLIVVF